MFRAVVVGQERVSLIEQLVVVRLEVGLAGELPPLAAESPVGMACRKRSAVRSDHSGEKPVGESAVVVVAFGEKLRRRRRTPHIELAALQEDCLLQELLRGGRHGREPKGGGGHATALPAVAKSEDSTGTAPLRVYCP
jgi:hypothetical protein